MMGINANPDSKTGPHMVGAFPLVFWVVLPLSSEVVVELLIGEVDVGGVVVDGLTVLVEEVVVVDEAVDEGEVVDVVVAGVQDAVPVTGTRGR